MDYDICEIIEFYVECYRQHTYGPRTLLQDVRCRISDYPDELNMPMLRTMYG